MADHDITVQLVPPGIHRANAAERAIRTFKNHIIAGLCSTDPDFPIQLWDRIIPQAILSLNLLRASRVYNHTPIAPPGTHVLIHEKPGNRDTWAPHAIDAWYIALKHYRCYRTYVWETRSERTTDTLTWMPKCVVLPQLSPTETIIQCTQQITAAMQQLYCDHPIRTVNTNRTTTSRPSPTSKTFF
jgi:hypothetical protein